jgi:hypothetical protein
VVQQHLHKVGKLMLVKWGHLQQLPGNATMTYNTASTNTGLTPTGTSTNAYAFIKGIIRVTVAGTVIPQVSLGVAQLQS